MPDVRPSPIAGQWYPGDARRLAASVDGYLAAARLATLDGAVVAVVAPHAGYRYSGPVAGHAFACVTGRTADVVAVVGPMHAPAPGRLLTTGHDAYETPLGLIPVDRDAIAALDRAVRAIGEALVPVRDDDEHAIEIELPLLQRALAPGFALLPVMVREDRPAVVRGLGEALAESLAGRRALLVASTDLSHYYAQRVAEGYDREMLRRVQALDPDAVLAAEAAGAGFA
jgi:hypothetical protein